MKKILVTYILLVFGLKISNAQMSNEAIYNTIKKAQNSDNKADAIIKIASKLIGKPYLANTLEEKGEERLIVNLSAFDCTTLVESCIGMVNSKNYTDFEKELIKIRYRNGIVDGYGSRIHYLSEWLIENKENKTLQIVPLNNVGRLNTKKINFISNNWTKYPRANSDKIKNEILTSEKLINQQKFLYIPKNKIDSLQHLIKNGDIIAITTSIPSLDFSHQGFAIFVNNKLHLLHASSAKKKVIISDETLSNYLIKNKLQTGIVIARLQ